MSLYLGTNYHPHDWSPERWRIDIGLMKEAGFTTVRLGHLCWDSYEPENGVYTFEWFDEVMDLFAEAGIGVILDISMHPAPIWVHELCKGVNLGGINGDHQYPVRRYMEDVSDQAYQFYAYRFARTLVTRYKDHPALFAFGLCNELGWASRSYSKESLARYISWLRKKYGTIENLNKAWSTQRWSRRLNDFGQIGFPQTEKEVGSPEAWLDMRRFFGQGVGNFIVGLQKIVETYAPGARSTSNHFAENGDVGFNYFDVYEDCIDYPGLGFYYDYGNPDCVRTFTRLMEQRLTETDKPLWPIEFQTGFFGYHHGPKGMTRMAVMNALIHRTQLLLGWTFRTMLGGEEQFLHGMLDHDGTPTVNYEIYRRCAAEFKKLENYAFPYVPVPEIAVVFSQDSDYFTSYPGNTNFYHDYNDGAMKEIAETFYELNRDYNVVSLKKLKHSYRVMVIPECCIISEEEAQVIRAFTENGGTVVMTAYSGILNEHGTAYALPQPAPVADVFGIRINGFERPTKESYFEEIQLKGAEAYRTDPETGAVLVSVHPYGKGKAYYTSSQMDHKVMVPLLQEIIDDLGLQKALDVPCGIQARKIADGQYFYVNTTPEELTFTLPGKGKWVLAEQEAEGTVTMNGYDADLFVTEE